MNIRKAETTDIGAISDLAVKTYIDAFGSPYENAEELAKWIDETRSEKYFKAAFLKNILLVAEDAGKIVAYAEFGPAGINYPASNRVDGDQEISRGYVLREYQGRRIGKALLDKILSYPQCKDARHIYLDVDPENLGAQRLYQSYGFKDTGEKFDDSIIMVREKIDSA